MAQKQVWENEYRSPQLVTKGEEPQNDVLRLLRVLKKKYGLEQTGLKVLDLGSGTGRNGNYLAELGNSVVGVEIAPTAVRLARERAQALGVSAEYHEQSMADRLPLEDLSVDLAIDITSSNSLLSAEREAYFAELARVLKPGAFLVLKTLCKEGDKNAKELLVKQPGPEPDTYVMAELGLTERVFSREDLLALYTRHFELLHLDKKSSYTRMNNRSYKRNFWLALWRKK
ncbi:class I SAM-dependent methyltransferase [Candidatus Falkowbacteria bacterium]|nr:class I SAM-dependent methyltransferase [Candidatus Falkowbacteria bacterium]